MKLLTADECTSYRDEAQAVDCMRINVKVANLSMQAALVPDLVEALKPFAAFSQGYGPYGRDDDWVLIKSTSGKRTITMGDVRAAEAILAKVASE